MITAGAGRIPGNPDSINLRLGATQRRLHLKKIILSHGRWTCHCLYRLPLRFSFNILDPRRPGSAVTQPAHNDNPQTHRTSSQAQGRWGILHASSQGHPKMDNLENANQTWKFHKGSRSWLWSWCPWATVLGRRMRRDFFRSGEPSL